MKLQFTKHAFVCYLSMDADGPGGVAGIGFDTMSDMRKLSEHNFQEHGKEGLSDELIAKIEAKWNLIQGDDDDINWGTSPGCDDDWKYLYQHSTVLKLAGQMASLTVGLDGGYTGQVLEHELIVRDSAVAERFKAAMTLIQKTAAASLDESKTMPTEVL